MASLEARESGEANVPQLDIWDSQRRGARALKAQAQQARCHSAPDGRLRGCLGPVAGGSAVASMDG